MFISKFEMNNKKMQKGQYPCLRMEALFIRVYMYYFRGERYATRSRSRILRTIPRIFRGVYRGGEDKPPCVFDG